MRNIVMCLLLVVFAAGCGKKEAPPIQLDVVAPTVTKQLSDRFGDSFVKVGKVQYDTSKNCYHVEVFYKTNDQEKRYVMEFIRFTDTNRQLTMYRGQFPLDLVGEGNPQGRSFFPVTIDEMMNQ